MTQAGPITRMAELTIDPQQLASYRALLAEEISASLEKEPGVLMLSAVALADDPSQIRIMEIYASQQAYEAHLLTPHFLHYKVSTAGMVRALTLREVVPVCIQTKTITIEGKETS